MALTSAARLTISPAVPTVYNDLPVAAAETIYNGAALEWTGGYLTNVSGAGEFAGFAMVTSVAVAGEASGDRVINVAQVGAVELDITTDTVAVTDMGDSTQSIEATDENTFRIETGAAITGTTIGQIMKLITLGVAGRVMVSFRAPMIV